MRDGIYPNWARDNCFASVYCELAMDHCYQALCFYQNIEDQNFHVKTVSERGDLEKHIIATIVFSGMCLEAFFNDYAAACLGDSEFYENFEKLDVKSKFVLIAKFILKAEIDKSKSYYSYLIALIRKRNTFVHNKSYKSEFQGYSEEELLQIHEDMKTLEQEIDYDNLFLDKTEVNEIKSDLSDCLNALRAIRDIAYFIDQHDSDAYALIRLMYPSGGGYSDTERQRRNVVFSKIGMKVN